MEMLTSERLVDMFDLSAEEYVLLKRIYARELAKCGLTEDELPGYPSEKYNASAFLSDLAFKAIKMEAEERDGEIWVGEYNPAYGYTNNTTVQQIMEYNRDMILSEHSNENMWIPVYVSELHWKVALFLCLFKELKKEKENSKEYDKPTKES